MRKGGKLVDFLGLSIDSICGGQKVFRGKFWGEWRKCRGTTAKRNRYGDDNMNVKPDIYYTNVRLEDDL